MKLQPKRWMFASAVAWVGAALPFGGVVFAQSQTQARPKQQMADDVFKNLQVLKGLTVDDFMGTMGLFSAALNVCCGDCHTGAGGTDPKWEDDAPPRKKTARRMVEVMKKVNRDSFGGAQMVTCWTCHRGSGNPATTPAIDAIYSDPVAMPSDVLPQASAGSVVPSIDQILDKYIQALGGAEQLAKLTSYTAKGSTLLYDASRKDPVEIYAKAPDRVVTIVHQREGDLARTFDGQDAWVMLPATVVKEYQLHASALEGGKLDAQMAFPGGIKQFFTTWRVSYPATLDNRDVYVVQGARAPGFITTFYFDKETGLLTRMVRYADSAVGRVPTQIDFSDYRPVAGVLMPFKRIFGWVSGREEYTLTEIQPNISIDDAKFAKPIARAQ
jgi:photosynthetic reaction center cytochrome c subunit